MAQGKNISFEISDVCCEGPGLWKWNPWCFLCTLIKVNIINMLRRMLLEAVRGEASEVLITREKSAELKKKCSVFLAMCSRKLNSKKTKPGFITVLQGM